jgi:hypothetical protein
LIQSIVSVYGSTGEGRCLGTRRRHAILELLIPIRLQHELLIKAGFVATPASRIREIVFGRVGGPDQIG